MTLADRIIAFRKAKGMTQGELAKALCVSRQSVSKWETGQTLPDLDKVVALSELFGVTVDELVHDGPDGEEAKLPMQPIASETVAKEITKKPWVRRDRIVRGAILLFAGCVTVLTIILVSRQSDKKQTLSVEPTASETKAAALADSTPTVAAPPPRTSVATPTASPTPAPSLITVEGYGNLSANQSGYYMDGGRAVAWNGKIVFSGCENVYTMEPDGSDITVLSNTGGRHLNAVEDSLFYCSFRGSLIYRIDANGCRYHFDVGAWRQIEYLSYYNGYLYYVEMRFETETREYYAYRIRTDLQEPEELFCFPSVPSTVCLFNNCLCYIDAMTQDAIYAVDLETRETRTVFYRADYTSRVFTDGQTLYAQTGGGT